jgi:hypothetical protein
LKTERREERESSALRRRICHTWGWARSRETEVDHKSFKLDQGGQAGDKVIGRKNVILDVGKVKLDEVVGRQKNCRIVGKGKATPSSSISINPG